MSDPTDVLSPLTPPGEYQVVARRYRPQTFGELVGQEHIGQALAGAITSHRVGHAYLFTGARGVGKTSSARILAKALNCEQGPTPTPCNQCDMCQRISTGDDVDVLEIDGASNRGIDEMRELRQNVNIRPSRSRFKIYIIDEVHMLTREAFNALLKTLEEPPEHVKFIFCTTEAEKIPITILSRCQRFDFAGIQTQSIAARLRQIVEAEHVTAEPEALAILARRASGSMRDSQSLLEQLLSGAGKQITVADVHRLLGTAGDRRLSQLAGHLVFRDAAGALADLDSAISEGVDVGQLLEQLLGYFRDVMVAAVGAPADAFLYCSTEDQPQVQAASKSLGVETVLAVMQIIDQTLARLRYSIHGRTLAELALVRISKLDDLDQLPQWIGMLRDGAAASPAPRGDRPVPARPVPSQPALPDPAVKKKSEPAEVAAQPPVRAVESAAPERGPGTVLPGLQADIAENLPDSDVSNPTASPPTTQLTPENVGEIWEQVLALLGDVTSDMASKSDDIAISAPNRLVVSFRAKYTFCKTYCEQPDRVAKLEKTLASVTGEPVRIEFQLRKDEASQEPMAREKTSAPTAPEPAVDNSQHPLVRRAAELFRARPVKFEAAAKSDPVKPDTAVKITTPNP
jgi:DNA polymerase-3 subunit gamma/tau